MSTLLQKLSTDSLSSTLSDQISASQNYSYADLMNQTKQETIFASEPQNDDSAVPISPDGVNVVTDSTNSVHTNAAQAIHHRHHSKIHTAITGTLEAGVPATPQHNLVYNGGKTIANLSYVNLYLGDQASWQQSDINSIDSSLSAAMSDRRLNTILSQYFPNQTVTSQFLGSTVLAGSAPKVASEATVKSLLTTLDQSGALKGFDLSTTAFNFLLPRGTVLTDGQTNSLHGLGAYHGSVHVTANGKVDTIYYAVGVYPERYADGSSNGIPVFSQPWQNTVAEFYHELSEIRTDADVEDANKTNNSQLLGWISPQGDEIGDFPVTEAFNLKASQLAFQQVPLANGTGTVPVQLLYSNAVNGIADPNSIAVV
jgi:hypothetical protein